MRIVAFEFQDNGEVVRKTIPNDGVVSECQAWNEARLNHETLIGLMEGGSGIHRQILYRPDSGNAKD